MKVYLLTLNDRRPIVVEANPREGGGAGVEAEPGHKGLRGWSERTIHRGQQWLRRSDSALGKRARRLWDWLHTRTFADEPLLMRSRNTPGIDLHHPSTLSPDEARSVWSAYLADRLRRHLFWLVINVLICPLTLVLVPLPGPNVVGFWFVYRAACHGLASIGIRRLRTGRVPTTYHPDESLDASPGETDDERTARIVSGIDLESRADHDATMRLSS